MGAIDPFADVAAPVQPGSLEGINLEPSAPVEGSWLDGPDPALDMDADPFVEPEVLSPEQAAETMVQQGSLQGDEGEMGDDDLTPEEEERFQAALAEDLPGAADLSLDGAGGVTAVESPAVDPTMPPPGFSDGEPLAGEGSAPTLPEPDSMSQLPSASNPLSRLRRGRPRTVTPREGKRVVTFDWVVFAEGVMDNGEPFWWKVGVATGRTREAALRDWHAKQGTESVSVYLTRADGWRMFTVTKEQASRPYTKMVIS